MTVAALPELLKKLKEDGFHVVHVVPGTGEQAEIASTAPSREANAFEHRPVVGDAAQRRRSQRGEAPRNRPTRRAKRVGQYRVPPPAIEQRLQTRHQPETENSIGSGRHACEHQSVRCRQSAPASAKRVSCADAAAQAGSDQAASVHRPQHRLSETTADRQMPGTASSARSDPGGERASRDPDDPNWPKARCRLAIATSALNCRCQMSRLSAPTIIHGARSNWPTARRQPSHFALDAVPQSDRPTAGRGRSSDEPQFPVPAMPVLFRRRRNRDLNRRVMG